LTALPLTAAVNSAIFVFGFLARHHKEPNVNEGLWSLVNLQEADLKIAELKRRIAIVPDQMATLDAQLTTHDTLVTQNKAKLTDAQKERRRLEGDVELLRGKLSKYKDQLMAVKKNEEYTAVLKEIESCKNEIDRAEDRILEFMEFGDTLEKEMKAKETELREAREQILQQKEKLQSHLADLQAELSRVDAARAARAGQVPADLMTIYNRIAHQRRGIALAEARDEMCAACHVRLRPQVLCDVRLGQQIITCESCTRILYWKGEVATQVQTDA
jgi:hypothetical protein